MVGVCNGSPQGWAAHRSGDRNAGLQGLREGLAQLRKQKNRLLMPFLLSLAAEIEEEAKGAQRGLSTIDAAVVEAAGTGFHQYAAETHRIRGEILLKRDRDDAAPAEEAFQTAIAVAKRQGTRSFRAARRALAREALPLDGPPRRRPRCPRPGARRLFANPGNARDRGGAGAARGARPNRGGQD